MTDPRPKALPPIEGCAQASLVLLLSNLTPVGILLASRTLKRVYQKQLVVAHLCARTPGAVVAVFVKHLARRPDTTAGELVKQKVEWLVPCRDSALATKKSNSLDLTEGCINVRRFEL